VEVERTTTSTIPHNPSVFVVCIRGAHQVRKTTKLQIQTLHQKKKNEHRGTHLSNNASIFTDLTNGLMGFEAIEYNCIGTRR
jgi:hypothetical protein